MKAGTTPPSRTASRTLAGLAALAVATAAYAASTTSGPPRAPRDDLRRAPECVHSATDLSVAFERVAESIRESVVSIRSAQRVAADRALQPVPFDRFPFGDLFGFGDRRFREQLPRPPQEGFVRQGLGTGFVISEDGYVLTNNHVVADSDEVTVTLWDESAHVATVVGTDPKTDLAVLRIEAEGLKPAPLGDDAGLRVGHWVAAVGNPFGLSSTMTAGIVSAVGRSRVGLADYEDFIQTDAAINPGNSGGPLVNLDGEVVGVNTAIFSRSGGYMGIGFAIPIGMARSIADRLIEHGHVQRGFLGVVIQDLDRDLAASFGFEGTDGALVSDVSDDGPAARAGIEPGDVVVRLGAKTVDDIDTLRLAVADAAPGSRVEVELVRDGERQVRTVEIGELEPAPVASAAASPARDLGLDAETLTPRLARRLDLPQSQRGVLVTRLEPFGPAAHAGLRLNDVILAVDGAPVESTAELEGAPEGVERAGGARLTVLTGSTRRFVFLRLPS